MTAPRARGGRAPALAAAALFAGAIWCGAFSVGGLASAWAGVGLSLLALAFPRLRRAGIAGAVAFAGFGLGLGRLARPAAVCHAALGELRLDEPLTVEGRLTGFVSERGDARMARFRILRILQNGRAFPFDSPATVWIAGTAPLDAAPGDSLTAAATLRRAEPPVSWRDLPEPGERFRVEVKSALLVAVRRASALGFPARANEWAARRLARSSLSRRDREEIAALWLGRSGDLDEDVASDFRRGGVYHLLVISGLHVGVLAAMLAGLLSAMGLRRRPREGVLIAAVLAFALFCGGAAPVARAAVTLALILGARLLELPVSTLQATGVSAIAVLAADPSELFRAGFSMTYAAVIGIAVLAGPIASALSRARRPWALAVGAAIAAQIAVMPVALWRFNLASPAGWLCAPLAAPLLAVLLATSGGALACLLAGVPPGVLAWAFSGTFAVLRALARGSGAAAFLVATPPLWGVAALLALAGAAGYARGRMRAVPLAAYASLLLVLALRRGPSGPARGVSVEALDVGQGDAILLRQGRRAMLFDGGGSFETDDEDLGRIRLLPKLLDRGVTRLDGVVLSHPHPDHALGLFCVLRDLPVGCFYEGGGPDVASLRSRLDRVARERSVRRVRLRAGERLAWAGGWFSVLSAGERFYKSDTVNNSSLVMLYRRGDRRILLMGDAGYPVEGDLVADGSLRGRVDVLKVGHHGSRTATSPEFLAAIHPRVALLSCGRHNRFGHPAPRTLEALRAARVPLLRTDLRSDVAVALLPGRTLLRERGVP